MTMRVGTLRRFLLSLLTVCRCVIVPWTGWQYTPGASRASRVTTEKGFVAYDLPYAEPNPNTVGQGILTQ